MAQNYCKKLFLFSLLSVLLANFQLAKAGSFQILNLNVSKITDRSVEITWQTNRKANGLVIFGPETDKYEYWSRDSYPNSFYHKAVLSNLLPDTTYHFRVKSRDFSGNQIISNNQYFKTKKHKDILPPKISEIKIISITGTTSTITWKTDEPARDIIKYGTTPECRKTKTIYNYQTFHEVTLFGLKPNTKYYFQFQSKDSSGNVGSSGVLNFRTSRTDKTDKEPLIISYLAPISNNDPNITEHSAIISWKTNRITSGEVCYGKGNSCSNILRSKPPKKLFHRFILDNLEPGTTYMFKVTSKDVFNNKKSSINLFFTTKKSNINFKLQADSSLNTSFSSNSLDNKIEFFPPSFYTSPTLLLTTPKTDKIYAILNGKKHWIVSPLSFESYGFYWSDVKTVSQEQLNKYPDVKLVKAPSRSTVYLLEKGVKRPIFSAKVFEKMGYKWKDVCTVNQIDLNAYPTGPMIL